MGGEYGRSSRHAAVCALSRCDESKGDRNAEEVSRPRFNVGIGCYTIIMNNPCSHRNDPKLAILGGDHAKSGGSGAEIKRQKIHVESLSV